MSLVVMRGDGTCTSRSCILSNKTIIRLLIHTLQKNGPNPLVGPQGSGLDHNCKCTTRPMGQQHETIHGLLRYILWTLRHMTLGHRVRDDIGCTPAVLHHSLELPVHRPCRPESFYFDFHACYMHTIAPQHVPLVCHSFSIEEYLSTHAFLSLGDNTFVIE